MVIILQVAHTHTLVRAGWEFQTWPDSVDLVEDRKSDSLVSKGFPPCCFGGLTGRLYEPVLDWFIGCLFTGFVIMSDGFDWWALVNYRSNCKVFLSTKRVL